MVGSGYRYIQDGSTDPLDVLSPEGYARCYEQMYTVLDTIDGAVQDVMAYRHDADADLAVLGRRWREADRVFSTIIGSAEELESTWRGYQEVLERFEGVDGWNWIETVDDCTEQVEDVLDGYCRRLGAFRSGDVNDTLNAFPEAEPFVRAWGRSERAEQDAFSIREAAQRGERPEWRMAWNSYGPDRPSPRGSPVTFAALVEKLADIDEVSYRVRHPESGEETRITEEITAAALDPTGKATHRTLPHLSYHGHDRTAEIGFGWRNGILWETMEPEPSHFENGATLILEWTSPYRGVLEDIPLVLQAMTGRLTLPEPADVAERLDADTDPDTDPGTPASYPSKGRLRGLP